MQRRLARQIYYDMVLARLFEQAAAEQYLQGRIGGFLHLYPGEEAVAVGTLRAADPGDYVVSTYREHVHALVRGTPPEAVMAELFGKATGCSRGYGGSMHLFDAERRFLGGYAIVGETFPVAIGVAYWLRLNEEPDVVLCYFGDGAVNQGTFHESLNMAALWKLPVLFVCENNRYQIGTEIHRHSAVPEVWRRACAYGMEGRRVDGMDVLAVHEATREALRHVREVMGLDNVAVMIPFVRTVEEGRRVLELMARHGLARGARGLKVYQMCEIPSNALLADAFLEHFDGFSIGSNDLTQLTLGADRDSGLLEGFDERDPAVLRLMEMAIEACRRHGKHVGICGQAPSDFPEIIRWLVERGIGSISLNPDSLLPMLPVVLEAEKHT